MCALVEREVARRPFVLRPHITPKRRGYQDLWMALNELFERTHPDAYFVCCINDELRLATRAWDTVLRRYVGLFPDHIFRLRTSRFRLRNYFDFWECGYAPEGLAFYTRRWLEIVGNWNPCFGPDNSQQYVAYYLARATFPAIYQFNRDAPIYDIKWLGEGVALNLDPEQQVVRNAVNFRLWFRQVSHEMQEELNRRARHLQAHIMNAEFFDNLGKIVEEHSRKNVLIIHASSHQLLYILPYRINRISLFLANVRRTMRFGYYGGGGRLAWAPIPYALAQFLIVYFPALRNFRKHCAKTANRFKGALASMCAIGARGTSPLFGKMRSVLFASFAGLRSRFARAPASQVLPTQRSWRYQVVRAIYLHIRSLRIVALTKRLSWAIRMKDARWLIVPERVEKDARGPI